MVAAVEAGRPPVEELEPLAEGRTLALAPGDRIVLAYLATCALETVAGPGSVRVGASAGSLEGGAALVGRRTLDCEGRPQPGTSAGEGGAARWRTLGADPVGDERARVALVALRAARAAAAPGRGLFGPGGACVADRPGAWGELCRLLGGALARMAPLPDAATALRLDRADGAYREGDRLVVTVEVPRGLGADHHLHVLYLDEAGEVLHLLPNPLARETRVGGGRRVVLGAAGREYRVGPPYGRGAVLALLSPRPLDPVGRREGEELGDLIAALQVALRRSLAGGSSVRFAAVGLETRPR
jgi:hypothetical protein